MGSSIAAQLGETLRLLRMGSKIVRPLNWLSAFALMFPLMFVTACGTSSRQSAAPNPNDICLILPAPDLDTDTEWMRDYTYDWAVVHKCSAEEL